MLQQKLQATLTALAEYSIHTRAKQVYGMFTCLDLIVNVELEVSNYSM